MSPDVMPHCSAMASTPGPAHCRKLRSTNPAFAASLKAGVPGAMAAAAQSASFMWISTAAACQYRFGFGMLESFRTLYAQGGIPRFYSGVIPTVVHVTLCRFGDTTANVLALENIPSPSIPLKTAVASVFAATWRAALLPLETLRANMQVKGPVNGRFAVEQRFKAGGLRALYAGAFASFTVGLLGHFPFFCTVNILSDAVPLPESATNLQTIGRNGGMGFVASMASDVVTNAFKIIATVKQTTLKPVTYYEAARKIVIADGLAALVTRGLKTRMIGNGLQGATFVLLWKEIERRRAASHTIVP